jgi:hypothetical protein
MSGSVAILGVDEESGRVVGGERICSIIYQRAIIELFGASPGFELDRENDAFFSFDVDTWICLRIVRIGSGIVDLGWQF